MTKSTRSPDGRSGYPGYDPTPTGNTVTYLVIVVAYLALAIAFCSGVSLGWLIWGFSVQ